MSFVFAKFKKTNCLKIQHIKSDINIVPFLFQHLKHISDLGDTIDETQSTILLLQQSLTLLQEKVNVFEMALNETNQTVESHEIDIQG